MARIVPKAAACLASALMLAVSVGSAAVAGQPIKAGQHFIGLVNGSHKDPVVVYTVCPGPIGPNRTGPVAGKQTMGVVHVKKGHGYTGLFSSIYAWFQPTANHRPVQLHFRTYSTPKKIPQAVTVPCGGTGKVVFSSCPYLAPCAAGWVTYEVKVKFEDIAA